MAYTRQGVVDEQGKEREILLQCQLEEGHTGEHEASETQQDEPGGKVTYRRRTWAWTPSAWASSRSIGQQQHSIKRLLHDAGWWSWVPERRGGYSADSPRRAAQRLLPQVGALAVSGLVRRAARSTT